MTESLFGFVITRLDQIESPVFLHRELERFPPADLAKLQSEGLLWETSKATEIPRPKHLPAGDDLIVRQSSKGLFGVAGEDNYFDPIPLVDDDIRQYEVSLPKLVAYIRRENGINGTYTANHNGLVPLGQKVVNEFGVTDVYLSLPNADESTFLSRCQRLERPAGTQKVVMLTLRGVSLSPEGRRILNSAGVVVVSLMDAALSGTLVLDWNHVAGRAGLGLAEDYPKDNRIFLKQGETWLVVYDSIPKSIGNSIGMAYICCLLQSSGQETHAFTLRGGVASEAGTPLPGSAGKVLDEQALREYKERITEIDEELAEAKTDNDLASEERLSEEREALYAEIGQATGLQGKNREASSDRERARQSVSTAIHRALRAIKKQHESLWQHLHNSLKIGSSYLINRIISPLGLLDLLNFPSATSSVAAATVLVAPSP